MQQQDIQAKKNEIIDLNYASVYARLLPYEGQINEATRKPPFQIGNKHVHALSDIEGFNIKFLEFLKELGLVKYQEFAPANLNGWKKCLSLKKNQSGEFPVYYKFNEEACKKFNDVIVLCGDYVRNTRNTSEGVVNILEELNNRLNNGRKEEHKGLYLVAGNHDVADYSPEIRSGDTQHDLKAKVLKLGLYPQLLLVNGDGKKLLFQHTNFPYREHGNYIVNKQIDVNKAYKLLNELNERPTMLQYAGFFNLRYLVKNCEYVYEDLYHQIADRKIYSDDGLGYDVKVIGHDSEFIGADKRGDRSCIYNVNINNWEQKPWITIRCNSKFQAPPIKPFVPDKKNIEYPKVINFGLNNKYTKNIFEKAVSFFCGEKKSIQNDNVKIKFYSLNQYNSFKDKLNELNNASR